MAIKIIELIGTSSEGFEKAVQEAIDKTEQSIKNLKGIDVLGFKASVGSDGKISEYRAHVNVAFEVR